MNPETIQNNPVQSPATQGGQALDPSVVALTKAIGQQESGGNYNAPQGKNGEIGAYQMTPSFINQYAPKYLKDYNASQPLTSAQQDELAYSVVKDWGTNGDPSYSHLGKLTPAQIASAWNSGDPNSYLDPGAQGTNSQGAQYNVPDYVNKIQQNYEKNMGTPQTTEESQPTQQPAKGGGNILDTILGILNPTNLYANFISMGAGVAALGATGLSGLIKQALPAAGSAIGGALGGPEGAVVGETVGNEAGNLVGGQSSQTTQPLQDNTSQTSQPDVLQEIESLNAEVAPAKQASDSLATAYQTSLGTTIGNRKALQDPQLQTGIQSNAKYGLAPTQDINGGMDFTDALKNSNNKISTLHDNTVKMLNAEGTTIPANSVMEQLVKEVENDKSIPIDQKMDAYENAREVYNKYASRYQDGQIPLAELQTIKQEQGKYFDKTASTPNIRGRRALSRAARSTIIQNTKNPTLYNAVMKEEQGLINGQAIMKRLAGRKAPSNTMIRKSILHAAGRYAAVYIGDKIGGPIGAILGTMVGEHIIRAADKRYGKNMFETPSMKAAMDILHDTEPKIYKVLLSKLKENGVNVNPKEINLPKGKTFAEVLKEKQTPIEKADDIVNAIQAKKVSGKRIGYIKPGSVSSSVRPKQTKGLLKPKATGKGLVWRK